MKNDNIKRYVTAFDATRMQVVMTYFRFRPIKRNLTRFTLMTKLTRNMNASHIEKAFQS